MDETLHLGFQPHPASCEPCGVEPVIQMPQTPQFPDVHVNLPVSPPVEVVSCYRRLTNKDTTSLPGSRCPIGLEHRGTWKQHIDQLVSSCSFGLGQT